MALEASTFELSSCRIGRGCYVKPLNKETLGTMGGLALRFLGDPQLPTAMTQAAKGPSDPPNLPNLGGLIWPWPWPCQGLFEALSFGGVSGRAFMVFSSIAASKVGGVKSAGGLLRVHIGVGLIDSGEPTSLPKQFSPWGFPQA